MDIKVGVLIPRSDIFPLFPQQVLRGIKLAFEKQGITPQFKVEDIGKAVIPDVVLGKANSLLMEEVDITFAWVGRRVAENLKELYKAAKKPLLLMGVSASVDTDDEMGAAPYIFSNSLDMWQSTLLLGKYVGQHYKGNVLNSIGFFECGYNFSALFAEGFENDENKIVATHISKKMEDVDFTETLPQMINDANPNLLTLFYSGIDADKVYDLCVRTGITKGLPIVTLGVGTAPYIGKDYPVISAQCWNTSMDNEVNKDFVTSFESKYKVAPDAYTMVAYETALAVCNAISKIPGDGFDVDAFCKVLQASEISSPRGVMSFDSTTQKNRSFDTIINDGGKQTLMSLTVDEVKGIVDSFATRIQAGWFNPYPCA